MRVMAIGAHPDDVELGCGATLAKHRARGDVIKIVVVGEGRPGQEARNGKAMLLSAEEFGAELRTASNWSDQRFDDLPILGINQYIEEAARDFSPDRVLTHAACDVNRDHQMVHDATLVAFRQIPRSPVREILTYEDPGSTDWGAVQFTPNYYVPVSEPNLDSKLVALAHFNHEMKTHPHPRSMSGVINVARFRGQQCGFPLAEAFRLVRAVWL